MARQGTEFLAAFQVPHLQRLVLRGRHPAGYAIRRSFNPSALPISRNDARLEIEFQRHLDLAGGIERGANVASRTSVHSGPGCGKSRVVGKVEKLRLEFQVFGFGDGEDFEERGVPYAKAIGAQDIPSADAVPVVVRGQGPPVRPVRKQGIAGGVGRGKEPALHGSGHGGSTDDIGVLTSHAGISTVTNRGREGQAGLQMIEGWRRLKLCMIRSRATTCSAAAEGST